MSDKTNYPFVRTIRFKSANLPGILGKITTAIGNAGTIIGNISMVHFGNRYGVRRVHRAVTHAVMTGVYSL